MTQNQANLWKRSIKSLFVLFSLLLLPIAALADGPRPRISAYVVGDEIKVENTGSCPLYRVEIYTIPPDKGDLSSVWSRLTALTVGAGSYSYKIGTIYESKKKFIPIRYLVNSSGERLDLDRVRVGDFVLDVNYCGYNHTMRWKP